MVLQCLLQLLKPAILNNFKPRELGHYAQHQLERVTKAKHKQNNVLMA